MKNKKKMNEYVVLGEKLGDLQFGVKPWKKQFLPEVSKKIVKDLMKYNFEEENHAQDE